MNRRILAIIIAGLCFILAVGIILYPAVSNYVNDKYQSVIQTSYEENVAQTDDAKLQEMLESAVAYNHSIAPGTVGDDTYSRESLIHASQEYEDQLCVTATGIMAYVDIPQIDVYLPIYHGTDSETLEKGIGHLLGSSLPVGGNTTHVVLTGHSGMASQTMFTDLHQLEKGDVFYIHVLQETLAYEVYAVNTVLPHETELLEIRSDEDLCTLVTCTPVGINSHRLLISGTRIPFEAAQEIEEIKADSPEESKQDATSWQDQYIQGILWGIAAVMTAAASGIIIAKIRKPKRKKRRKGGRYLCKKQSRFF